MIDHTLLYKLLKLNLSSFRTSTYYLHKLANFSNSSKTCQVGMLLTVLMIVARHFVYINFYLHFWFVPSALKC